MDRDRQEPNLVRPRFSVEVYPAEHLRNVPAGVSLDSGASLEHRQGFLFRDSTTADEMIAIISSDTETFGGRFSDLAESIEPVNLNEAALIDLAEKVADLLRRKPRASINLLDPKAGIDCYEETCRFYLNGGCANPDVLIDDDCGLDQSCLTYEAPGN